jgi:hypothetical protein
VLGVSNVFGGVVVGVEGEESGGADGGDAIRTTGGVVCVDDFFVGVDEGRGLFGGCVRWHCWRFVSCSRWLDGLVDVELVDTIEEYDLGNCREMMMVMVGRRDRRSVIIVLM